MFQLQKAVQSTIKSNLGGWQSDTSLFENSTGNPTLAELRGLIYSHIMHYLAVRCRSPPDLPRCLCSALKLPTEDLASHEAHNEKNTKPGPKDSALQRTVYPSYGNLRRPGY